MRAYTGKFLLFFSILFVVTCDAKKRGGTKPLILTPYLDKGDIKQAKKLALTEIDNVISYTGYFTVNVTCQNNLFFWFFLADEDWKQAAVLLWLNGGPGVTSLYGLFKENGPWSYDGTDLIEREYAWTKKHNVLYMDQPAGAGFSFTKEGCYSKNLTTIAQEVTSALFQFFKMFPSLQKNKFFLTGESYAGHYNPEIAVQIDKANTDAKVKINLVGLVVGNPLLDSKCLYVPDYLYELGIIDSSGRDETKKAFLKYVCAIDSKNYTRAYELQNAASGQLYLHRAKLPSPYNILYDEEEPPFEAENFTSFVDDYETRKLIHVGLTPFKGLNEDIFNTLYPNDAYISIAPRLEYLLKSNKYIVGFYAGQLDAVCPYSSLPCVLRRLQWPGASEYLKAARKPWYVSHRLAGWVKKAGNLFEIAVRASGHFVPLDQGEAVLDLISAVVADTPGTELLTRLKTTKD